MKNQKNIKMFSISKTFRHSVLSESMVSLANSFELVALIKRLGWRLLSIAMPRLRKLNGRLRQLHNFATFLFHMRDHHGAALVVKYLKSCQLAVQKAMAGTPVKSLREIEPELPLQRLSSSGLPKVIPLMDRRAIIAGSPSVIRW